jgi:2-oxoglutarate dehydrogenase E2 component (dihydrolipoamide succinyltransferase)
MATHEVKVPQLSESVAEATLLQWKKKAGDLVTQDEILIEIETDKVVLEVPSPSAGVISEILVESGGMVVSDQVIAKVDTDAKAVSTPAPSAPAPAAQAAASQPAPVVSSAPIAMPSAAKILAEKNIPATQVAGTGKDGRVTKSDALSAFTAPAPAVSKCCAKANSCPKYSGAIGRPS